MIRLAPVLVVLLLILAPSAAGARQPLRPWVEVTINGNPGVLLPRDAAHELVWQEVDGYWLPGEPWLTAAEDAVIDASRAIPEEDRRPRIDGYRQYAGYMLDGQRMIIINSSCDEFEDWRSEVIFVMDGGPCFWQATYNATTGELDALIVNGHA
jgi:hypothetical protein